MKRNCSLPLFGKLTLAEKLRRAIRGSRGFTLVEILVVLAIAAALTSIALPLTELAARRSKEEELRTSLRLIRKAIDDYKAATDEGRLRRDAGVSGYPKTLQVLVDGIEDQRDPNRGKIFFMRRMPRDPFAEDDVTNDARTWHLRSYQSSASEPRAGDDVYDVRSSSDRIGLNGVAYGRW